MFPVKRLEITPKRSLMGYARMKLILGLRENNDDKVKIVIRTSCVCSYVVQNIVQLFISWIRNKSEPRKRKIFIMTNDLLERLRSVKTESRGVIARQQHDVCPSVHVCDRLERVSDTEIRPGHTHHCVIGHVIIQSSVAAPFRKHRAVPVGQEVTTSYTNCIQSRIQLVYLSAQSYDVNVITEP